MNTLKRIARAGCTGLAALAMAACSTTVKLDLTHSDRAAQMPPVVAKRVLAYYLGNAWVEQPYVFSAPICGSQLVRLPISEMDYAQFDAGTSNRLAFGNSKGRPFSCNEGGRIIATRVATREQGQEVIAALMALGARFKQ